MPGGRPSTFKEEYIKQAEKLAMLGAIDPEIADFFEVDLRTLQRWKHKHPELCRALKIGKEDADSRVERSLYHRAVGYEEEDVKIFMPAGSATPVYAPYIKKIPPDTTAAIFWLKNRKPNDWRDKQSVDVTSGDKPLIDIADSIKAAVLKRGEKE